MRLFAKWLAGSAALVAASYIIPGISVVNFYAALVAILVLGVLNITLRPILALLTLPINMLTLGLFMFVVNALIFWFLSTIVKGLEVDGFAAALLGSLFVSAVFFIADRVLHKD